MKLSVKEELRGKRLSLIKAVILSSSGVPDKEMLHFVIKSSKMYTIQIKVNNHDFGHGCEYYSLFIIQISYHKRKVNQMQPDLVICLSCEQTTKVQVM